MLRMSSSSLGASGPDRGCVRRAREPVAARTDWPRNRRSDRPDQRSRELSGISRRITGPELVELMQEQAKKFGARVEIDVVSAVDLREQPFKLTTVNGVEHRANAHIVATGASPAA